MSSSLTFTVMLVSGCLVSYAGARRGNHIVVVIDLDLSPRRQKLALLRALTDGEYEAYELTLPAVERHRRHLATGQWRGLPRRQAMLAYVRALTDDEYEATIPAAEMARRQARRVVTVPRQPRDQVAV